MNKKLLAAAVSAAIMAPIAAQAEPEVTLYGRINNAIDYKDVDEVDDATTDISTISSRFGIKASSDLGNGLVAHAKYEFSTTTDKEGNGVEDTRVGTVGLSSHFGRVDIGNQWSAFFNTVGTDIDPTYTLGYYLYSGVAAGAYRASNTIKYSNSFGPVYLEADLRQNGNGKEGSDVAEKLNGGSGNGYGIGVKYSPLSNLTLSAAYDVEENEGSRAASAAGVTPVVTALAALDDTVRVGVSAKMTFGQFYGIIGWHQTETQARDGASGANSIEASQVQLYGGMNLNESTSLLLGYGQAEKTTTFVTAPAAGSAAALANAAEPTQVTLGVYHNMGGGLKLYYEAAFVDYDNDSRADPADATSALDAPDISRHLFGMRFDF